MIPEPDLGSGEHSDELRDQREFLLQSLRDLERERDAGDIDELDYTTLRDGYTARAAHVITQLEVGELASSRNRRRSTPIKVALIAAVVILSASGIGWFMATQLGQRLPGQSLSGGIADSTSSLLSQARAINFSDPARAVDLYSQVLTINPDNIEALTYRAWLIALVARDASDDLKVLAFATATEGLGRAIAIDTNYADAHCFLGIIRFRIAADAKGAKEELQICQDLNPPAAVKGFVDSIVAEVDAALDD
jgi:tetratricopeptide (TPR) repeat protein